jgi:hypothetical protein
VDDPRRLPLYDEKLKAGTWNERMLPGEFAVHYSSFLVQDGDELFCTVFSSLDEAVNFAQQKVLERPDLQCKIYDHRGFVGAPIREIHGTAFKDPYSLSPRFRRWVGSILFLAGLVLMIIDWRTDFALSWPGMIGSRILIPGFGLLLLDAILTLLKRRKRKLARGGETL